MLAGAILATNLLFGDIPLTEPTAAFSALLELDNRPFAEDGHTKMTCEIIDGGLLRNCRIDEETPQHRGLGPAALALAPLYKITPNAAGGWAPTVTIPTTFMTKGSWGDIPVALLNRPSGADIEAHRPAGAKGGNALVFCHLATERRAVDGRLFDCNGVLEGTANRRDPLVKAALAMAADLRVDPDAYKDVPAPISVRIVMHWPIAKP